MFSIGVCVCIYIYICEFVHVCIYIHKSLRFLELGLLDLLLTPETSTK